MNEKNYKIIDLTHTLHSGIPGWDGESGFSMTQTLDYADCTPPYLFKKHNIATPCGVGTHMDAPAHVIKGGRTIDQIEIHKLFADCVVIDVSTNMADDYTIMPEVITKFEEEHGEIKPDTFVIFYTGWSKYWATPAKYINNHKFPSVHIDTAKLLLARNIFGIGTDTLSTDTGADGFPVHQAILGADKYLVENIANAEQLVPKGAKVLILPTKIKDSVEAPVRMVALT